VGVDLNLQERLDQMYAEERHAVKNRIDIGLSSQKKETPASNRSKMLEFRRQQRANPELERAARRNELEVDLDTVKSEHLASGGMFKDIVLAADLYGIYEDLFGPDLFFTPSKELNLHFDFDEDYITPVFRGNVIKPSEAVSQPALSFKNDEESCFYTLVMSNPDGHFTDDNAEYLHWMVGNIPCDGSFGTEETDIARLGENICPYLQPFPPYGTGFHRFVFILYKHKNKLDLSDYKQEEIRNEVNLTKRTFNTRKFYDKYASDEHELIIPIGMAFFQSDYDSTLHKVFHDILNMEEPKYEYNFLPQYVRPWNDLHKDHFANQMGFNHFLDKYRDPKEIQEEVLKKRLKTLDPFKGDLDREIKYPNAHYPHPDQREAKAKPIERLKMGPTWRLREIERERLRTGLYKDLDWFEPRRDPSNN